MMATPILEKGQEMGTGKPEFPAQPMYQFVQNLYIYMICIIRDFKLDVSLHTQYLRFEMVVMTAI